MNKRFIANILARLIACVVLLALGVGIMQLLSSMRERPVQAKVRERAIRVNVQEVVLEDIQVQITGYGEVRSRDVVSIAAEIPGRVIEVHSRLDVGEVIAEGDVLFRIDPRNYVARLEENRATAQQWENTIARLRQQYAIDQDRLKTLERSKDLAHKEYRRVRMLFDEDQVGTQSSVDQAERALNTTTDQADQLAQTVDLFPIRIREAQSSLASTTAMGGLAEADLERTTIRAPFNARIKTVLLEKGQYVTPGANVMTLANDSVLEISVPMNSREARDWLQFERASPSAKSAWFSGLKHTLCQVQWTETSSSAHWLGTLHRVEKFDQQTRTLTVVIRVQGEDALSADLDRLPLVEGMFCKVTVPGRVAKNVVRLPAEAVGFDLDATGFRTVFVAKRNPESGEERLKTVHVRESHLSGEYVFVSDGLEEGDRVIVTRLVNPLENSLLETNTVATGTGS